MRRGGWFSGATVVIGLCTALAVSGCTGETVPAPDSTAPAGALYGRVVEQDGRPVTDGEVELYQLHRDQELRTGMAVMSLGLFCLGDDICPKPVYGELSSQGAFAFPKRVMKDDPDLTLTAYADSGRDLDGARTSANIRDRDDPQRAPALMLWDPKVDVEGDGGRAKVTWTALDKPPHGPRVGHSVWVAPRNDDSDWQPHLAEGPSEGRSARLDLRPYEDEPVQVKVIAGTKASVDGHEVEYAYTSPGHELPAAGPAPSRDTRCLTDDKSGRMRPVEGTCPLTDGDLDSWKRPKLSGECDENDKKCKPPEHERVCVDQGRAKRSSLVVLRTTFRLAGDDVRVEVSDDAKRFRSVGRGAEKELIVVRYASTSSRFVCVRGDLVGLREVSIW